MGRDNYNKLLKNIYGERLRFVRRGWGRFGRGKLYVGSVNEFWDGVRNMKKSSIFFVDFVKWFEVIGLLENSKFFFEKNGCF